jgi:hypothetical protein
MVAEAVARPAPLCDQMGMVDTPQSSMKDLPPGISLDAFPHGVRRASAVPQWAGPALGPGMSLTDPAVARPSVRAGALVFGG